MILLHKYSLSNRPESESQWILIPKTKCMTKCYFGKGKFKKNWNLPQVLRSKMEITTVDFSPDVPSLLNAEAVAQNPSLSVTSESCVSACGEVQTFQSEIVSVVFFQCM